MTSLPAGTYAEVIGDPIAHSLSPVIHRFWLERLGLAADYRATRVAPERLGAFLAERMADPLWRGCNVTIPHKIAALDHVPDPGALRASIGAANTIARGGDEGWFATNTDAGGFALALGDLDLAGAPVAVAGTGGAARAVLFALKRLGAGPVRIIARNPLKGAGLLATFGLKGDVAPFDAPIPPVALLVNASPLGMTGQPDWTPDLDALPDGATVYDLVYVPRETSLLRAASRGGLATIDGLGMLIGQAALAFELFFGAAPPEDADDDLRARLDAAAP